MLKKYKTNLNNTKECIKMNIKLLNNMKYTNDNITFVDSAEDLQKVVDRVNNARRVIQ